MDKKRYRCEILIRVVANVSGKVRERLKTYNLETRVRHRAWLRECSVSSDSDHSFLFYAQDLNQALDLAPKIALTLFEEEKTENLRLKDGDYYWGEGAVKLYVQEWKPVKTIEVGDLRDFFFKRLSTEG